MIHEYDYYADSDSIYSEYFYEYDDNGNCITKKSGYDTQTYEYDDNNNLIYEHYDYSYGDYGFGYEISYDYDEYGRQIGWTDYDTDGNETSHSVVEYE